MKPQLSLGLLALLFISLQTIAQQRTITGTVTNATDGSPIADASVTAIGEKASTRTNADGTFSINVSPDAKQIQITHIGLEPQTIDISSASEVTVSLTPHQEACRMSLLLVIALKEKQQ